MADAITLRTATLQADEVGAGADAPALFGGGEEVALTYTGVTLTVHDLEKAFWKAMRDKPLEINLPRWRGWLTKLNHLNPSIMLWLYEPMKRRGMKRLEKIRRQRSGQGHGTDSLS